MPLPSEAEPRPPADFASALATAEPVMLVGGQAVNLWALYYHDRSMEFAPFVSRDADVLGDRATLEELGKLAGVKPQFFPLRPPSNEVGVVIAKDSSGLPLLIEVLRYVNGVNNEELRVPSYTLAIRRTSDSRSGSRSYCIAKGEAGKCGRSQTRGPPRHQTRAYPRTNHLQRTWKISAMQRPAREWKNGSSSYSLNNCWWFSRLGQTERFWANLESMLGPSTGC